MPAHNEIGGRSIDCGEPRDDGPIPAPAWVDDVAAAARCSRARFAGPGLDARGLCMVERLRLALGMVERDSLPSPRVVLASMFGVHVEWEVAGEKATLYVNTDPGRALSPALVDDAICLRDRLAEIYPQRPRGGTG
jgi:hypothetical protein